MRVVDYIIQFLKDKGVKCIFLLPGGGAMFLNDAVACCSEMKYIAVHHEQSAAIAAEASARYENTMGVAMVTAGPGATNAITGVAGAWIDSVPVMILSGQSKTTQTIASRQLDKLRQLGAQEVNIIPMVKGITKYAVMVEIPESIKYHLERAYHLANSGRPGPVWLDIPLDIQGAEIDELKLKGYSEEMKSEEVEEKPNCVESVRYLIQLIQEAKRPVIIAGRGLRTSDSGDLLKKMLEKFHIPVVTTRLGCDVIEYEHPYFIGHVGIRGDRAGNFAMQNSDLIISLGSRLGITVTGYDYNYFAREAKVVMVDIDDNELSKETIKIDYPMKYELKQFLSQLMNEAKAYKENGKTAEWCTKCREWKDKYPSCLADYWKESKYVNSYCLVDLLSEKMKNGDIIISDAGSAIDVIFQAFRVKLEQHMILSGGLASMGYALPASLGIIPPDEQNIIVVTGDGSLQMNIQELATVSKYRKKIKVFLLNNKGYLTIRGSQENHFKGRFIAESEESGLGFPNFKTIAEAYKISYEKIENHTQLHNKIEKVLAEKGPVLCEVLMDPKQVIAPKQASVTLENGKIISRPLEDMAPFLEREIFYNEMIIKTIEE